MYIDYTEYHEGHKWRLSAIARDSMWGPTFPLEPQVVVKWVRLTCANRAASSFLYDEIGNAPGFSLPNECGNGRAEDRKLGDGPSPEKSPSDPFPPGASSSGE